MTPEALTQTVQTLGATGAVLLAALLALRHVHAQMLAAHAQLAAVQEKRVADAQLATAKLIEFVDTQREHQALLAGAIDNQADAVRELRLLFEHLAAERGVNRLPLTSGGRGGRLGGT